MHWSPVGSSETANRRTGRTVPGRQKRKRFAEVRTFPNVFEPDQGLKVGWERRYFENDNPITLELACGKGEYTLELARRLPRRNFVGIDIKGDRLWRGAKMALEEGLQNVLFLRMKIESLPGYFEKNTVQEIWLTFPDPFPKKRHTHKRLTAPSFLKLYLQMLAPGGVIHLKTDDPNLYEYTLNVLKSQQCPIHAATEDLYASRAADELTSIKTTYERRHLQDGKKIKYARFGCAGI